MHQTTMQYPPRVLEWSCIPKYAPVHCANSVVDINAQWSGAYFWMQDLSTMRGGYLPPYLHSGLVFIFIHNPHDSQSNMHSGYLTPYLHSGLVYILRCKTFPICMVDIYHCICIVVWCIFWDARPFQYAW